MDLGLTNRVAFVAGASSGLGLAVSKQLLLEGCRVAMCSRSQDRIEAAAEKLRNEGLGSPETIFPIVCDVTEEHQIQGAMEQVKARFGEMHILVTNAGGPPAGYIDDFVAAQWRDALELNLMSTINMCRAALPMLREAASASDPLARIVMITSVSAKEPIPNLYLSNTARAGVQAFAKSLSLELGSAGITVNTILPGYTKTDRLTDLAHAVHSRTGQSLEEIETGWADSNALKRLGTPEEFAASAVFLCSKPAAYITGIGLLVDGGRVKHVI